MQLDQVGIHPRDKVWFNIHKPIHKIQQILRMNDILRMVISIDSENEFDKIQHLSL
jgi:hypothetical protein